MTKFIMNIFLFGIILINAEKTFAQKNWKEIITVEDVCESYPKVMKTMLDQFDLEHKGMEKVKSAYENDNLVEACQNLLDYYKNGNTAAYLRKTQPAVSDRTIAAEDTTLENVFIVQNVRGQVPFGEDGHRDWYYKGPNNDAEWAWLSNRHSQIRSLFNTYFETGNPKYAKYIDEFLRDFIIKSMPYPAKKSGTSIWRGLEVAARAKVWSVIFYGFLNNDNFSPATQLLMLSSLPDHAHYNRQFHAQNNWLTMEISALATVATNFPEYKNSGEWLKYAIATISESMKEQVYGDGTQTELTSHYHNVALRNFELFKKICDQANQPLPPFFNETIEAMFSYIAHVVRPDGFRILNNDGDRGSDRGIIMDGINTYHKKDWEYIITNGKSGEKPKDGPSYFYPWAGHLISRSGFDENAHWSFFDIGPWGSGHQHNDKLHLSISAYGRDLLVDAGRFAYRGETAIKFRPYAKSSAGHNLILIDGKGQAPGPKLAEAPVSKTHYKITDDFDYATNSFSNFQDTKGEIKHQRALFYVRGEFWVVVDRILTDQHRKIDALWHWHPECLVAQEHSIVKTNNEKGNLAVIPVGKQKFDLSFIKGQEEPEIQGWYSEEYNIYEPNVASKYSTDIDGNATMVWLLFPSEKETPKIKAKIIQENEEQVNIEVKSAGKKWQVQIPFFESENAELIGE
ncbi:alginate lyase family protein [Flexithrix dorotheae]|uniref:alginate lyase family protein n=1 Tax=Flexithrix dorotheae TaxID=70993 RepID=UPI000475FA6C|nr:alginate lyase family protein [Flexithrix dorotheae]